MGLDESQAAFGWVLLTSLLVYIPPALLGYRPHEIIRSWSHVPIIWLATNSIINNNNSNNPSLEQWQCLEKTYPCAVQVVAFSKTYLSRMSIPSEQNKTWAPEQLNGIYIMGLTNSRIPELLLFSTASNYSTAHYVVDMMTWWLATAPGHKNP